MATYGIKKLSEIVIEYTWNSRSEARAKFVGTSEGDNEDAGDSTGIAGLAKSIELSGQDTACDCGIPTDGPHKGKLMLVSGFRRATAIAYLASQKVPTGAKGMKPNEVAVKIYEGMTEAELRALNLRENVRDNLPAADVAYGIQQYKKSKPDATQKEIADMMGKQVPYVSKLLAITDGLKPALFRDWREGKDKPLPVAEMTSIAALKQAEQDAAYTKAKEDRKKDKGDKEVDPNGWIANAKKSAYAHGFTLGTLARFGVVHGYGAEKVVVDGKQSEAASFTVDVLKEIVKCKTQVIVLDADGKAVIDEKTDKPKKKPVTTATMNSIAKQFDVGYNKGLEEPEEEEEEEEEEEDTE